jgi:hypothetical protein
VVAVVCNYAPAASEGGYTAWTRRAETACPSQRGDATTSRGSAANRRLVRPADLPAVLAAMDPSANNIVHIRFQRRTSMVRKLFERPFVIDVNGQPRLHRVTAALSDGPNIVRLPACLRAALGHDGGMYPDDIIPTAVPASVTGFVVETLPYVC